MKTDIHPKYTEKAKVACACGAQFVTGSTMEEIRVEVCSSCHPFYTGKQKFLDTARRVEKFKEKTEKKAAVASSRKGKKVKFAAKAVKKAAKSK